MARINELQETVNGNDIAALDGLQKRDKKYEARCSRLENLIAPKGEPSFADIAKKMASMEKKLESRKENNDMTGSVKGFHL